MIYHLGFASCVSWIQFSELFHEEIFAITKTSFPSWSSWSSIVKIEWVILAMILCCAGFSWFSWFSLVFHISYHSRLSEVYVTFSFASCPICFINYMRIDFDIEIVQVFSLGGRIPTIHYINSQTCTYFYYIRWEFCHALHILVAIGLKNGVTRWC